MKRVLASSRMTSIHTIVYTFESSTVVLVGTTYDCMAVAVEEAVAAEAARRGDARRTGPRRTRGARHRAVHAAAAGLLGQAPHTRGVRQLELDQILEVNESQIMI